MNAIKNAAPTTVTLTVLPIVFTAPLTTNVARVAAERAAVAEVSRAINAAYYAGIFS